MLAADSFFLFFGEDELSAGYALLCILRLLYESRDHKTGPAQIDDDFWIGNIEIEKGSTLPSQWVQDELYIFDTQLEKAEVTDLMKSSLAV